MIFKRRKPGEEGGSEAPREEPPPPLDAGAAAARPFTRPASSELLARPLPAVPKSAVAVPPRADLPRRVVDIPSLPRRVERPAAPAADSKKLIVGREICLNGHISACERLVVEGTVEAELNDCRAIEVADCGTFKGAAEVEGAEISGRFEGSLTVRERLLIRSSGRVTGKVRYGRLEIEQGGEINGEVSSLGAAAAPARHLTAAPAVDSSFLDSAAAGGGEE